MYLQSIGYAGWCSLECISNDSGVARLISAREHLTNEGESFEMAAGEVNRQKLVGFIALGRPTFDSEYAEQTALKVN